MPTRRTQSPKEKTPDFTTKQVFTTFDVAQICDANVVSIKNWIIKGVLRAFRTPGGHYRVRRLDLEAFLIKYDMPWPFDGVAKKTVLMLDSDPNLLKEVEQAIGSNYFLGFHGVLDAALFIGLERPDVVVLDLDDKGFDGLSFLKILQGNEATRSIPVVHFGQPVSEQGTTELRKDYNVLCAVEKTAGVAGLMEALGNLV